MGNKLRLNLQFFSDGEVFRGGYNPDEEIYYPEMTNPLLEQPSGEGVSDEPQVPEVQPEMQQQQPETTPQQTPTFDFGGRIVDPNDPETIKGAYEDFQNSQRYIQQLIQENRNMQQQFQQFQQQFSQPQAPQEPEVDLEKQNEQMMERFYENPTQFFKEIKQQAIEEARKEIEPILKERKIQSEIKEVSSKYQDFQNYIPKMQEIAAELGEQAAEQIGLERIYLMAKGTSTTTQPDPQQLIQDPNFLQQYVLNNPQIQQQFLQQYMSQKQQTQPPKVMGNTYGGTQSLASEQRPKSIGEASKLLRKSWGI